MQFSECSHCKSWSSHDAASQANDLYKDRNSENYDQKKGKILLAAKRWLLQRSYIRLLNRHGVNCVIDYGCGSGDLANSLSSVCKSVVAIDLQAHRPPTLSPDIEYRQGGLNPLLDKSSNRTAVFLRHVLEHITDPESVLKYLADELRKGDLLVLEFPSVNSAFRLWMGKYWPGYYPPFHVTLLDDGEVARIISKMGLIMVERSRREPPIIAGYISQRYGRINNAIRLFGLLLYPLQRLASTCSGREEALELVFVKR